MHRRRGAVRLAVVRAGACAEPAQRRGPAEEAGTGQGRQKASAQSGAAEAEHAHSEQGVGTQGLARPLSGTMLSSPALVQEHPAEKDAASLLSAAPGVNVFQGGAVSGLPTINGLADDRIRTELNGMLIAKTACANHMNPPLSFIDPGNVGARRGQLAGSRRLSKGGDAIGGSISVESPLPKFARAPGELLTAATLSSFTGATGDGVGVSGARRKRPAISAPLCRGLVKGQRLHRGGEARPWARPITRHKTMP